MRGCFVAGTDTGAGKTVLAAAMVAALRGRGERVAAFKPVLTGTDEPADPIWPPDDVLLAVAADSTPEAVAPRRFASPVSPHLAADLAGVAIDPAEVLADVRAAARDADAVVVEGVGGLLVPLAAGYDVRDLAADLALPVVVAARPALGTINHTRLTLAAARAAGLAVAAVVLSPWPEDPSVLERSNRATIAALGDVQVHTLAQIARPTVNTLAEAGGRLPLDRWVGARTAAVR